MSPFVLRSVDPPLDSCPRSSGPTSQPLGKRIVLAFDDELFLVLHLMIAGRLRWRRRASVAAARRSRRGGAESSRCPSLSKLTLASSSSSTARCSSPKPAPRSARRCSWCAAPPRWRALDPGGLEPLERHASTQFRAALTRENHTLKRALTDPHLFSGIGNAYSDEILHAARLSPLKLTQR